MQSFKHIPLIDISPIFTESSSGIQDIASQLRDIYSTVGFAYIINHGISENLISATFKASQDFHDLPFDEKNKIKQNKYFRGYMSEQASILKVSTLGEAKKPNQSEAFIMAHEVSEDDPDFIADTNLAGQNQWPENLDGFQETVQEYYNQMLTLARKMVQVFAVSFDLKQDALDHYFSNPTTFLRLQYYPEQPSFIPEDQFGIAPHTDYGFLTLLAQDQRGGLEVKNQDGEWIDAPPLPGSLVLNSGDMLKRMTNDRFISTPHRVINRSGLKRYSIPFFFEPNMHASIAPLSHFCDDQAPAKYEPIVYYEHLMARIRGNYDIGA